MLLLLKLAARATGLVLSLTVLCTALCTIGEHLDNRKLPTAAQTVAGIIDKGLSHMPTAIGSGAKRMLTALEGAVSDITNTVINRFSP